MDFEVKRWLKRKLFCTRWFSRCDRPLSPNVGGHQKNLSIGHVFTHHPKRVTSRIARHAMFFWRDFKVIFKDCSGSQSCWLESRWGYFRQWHWEIRYFSLYCWWFRNLAITSWYGTYPTILQGIPRFSKTPADFSSIASRILDSDSIYTSNLRVESAWIWIPDTAIKGTSWSQAAHKNLPGCFQKNSGTRKWMVKIMAEPYIWMDDLGVLVPLFLEPPTLTIFRRCVSCLGEWCLRVDMPSPMTCLLATTIL